MFRTEKSEILILYDSSSALDYKTDASLRKALSEDMEGVTLITVAQRASSVKNCDRILVISDAESADTAPTNSFWKAVRNTAK